MRNWDVCLCYPRRELPNQWECGNRNVWKSRCHLSDMEVVEERDMERPLEPEEDKDQELIELACVYLTTSTYPEGCTENRKRVIRKRSKKFVMKDGELYYKYKCKGKVCFRWTIAKLQYHYISPWLQEEVMLRFVQSENERERILHACHIDVTAGHMYMCLPTMAKAQIATLLATEQPAIKVNYMDVHMQSGGYDCGLFAIAFATALVYGNQPGHFIFHQEKMRAHLIQCLQQQEMSLFSVKKMRRSSRVKSDDEIRIYCVCRMPELTNTIHGYNVPPARSGITQIPAFRSLQSLWTHEPLGIVINVCSNLCCVYIHLVYHILHCLTSFGRGTKISRVGPFFPAKLVWGTNFFTENFGPRTIFFRTKIPVTGQCRHRIFGGNSLAL